MGEPLTRYRTVHVCRGGYTLGWFASAAIGGALITWLDPWWLGFLLAVLIYGAGLRFTHRGCHAEPAVCGHEAEGIGGHLRCVLDAEHGGWHKSINGSEWWEDHR